MATMLLFSNTVTDMYKEIKKIKESINKDNQNK